MTASRNTSSAVFNAPYGSAGLPHSYKANGDCERCGQTRPVEDLFTNWLFGRTKYCLTDEQLKDQAAYYEEVVKLMMEEPKTCCICGKIATRKVGKRGYCTSHEAEARADAVGKVPTRPKNYEELVYPGPRARQPPNIGVSLWAEQRRQR